MDVTGRDTGIRYTARALGRAAGASARAAGGGGTALPGKVLLGVVPDALARMAAPLRDGVILVSGTNGKTTTAAMIAAIARRAGYEVVHNRAGANTEWGVATALVEQTGDLAVLEVDEERLTRLAPQLRPRMIVLGNLFRDRLDAYGEVEAVVAGWHALSAATDAAFVLNADDALLSGVAEEAVRFGIDDPAAGRGERDHAADALHCRRCGAPYRFDAFLLAHLGHWRCARCGHARPRPDVAARSVSLDGLAWSQARIATPAGELSVRLRLPGLYSVYNALAATAAATALGVDLETIGAALSDVRPVFGRGEQIRVGERELLILLTKNPAGANEAMRALERAGGPHDLWIALNDANPDGRDVSWIWDAEFERLAGEVRTVTCSGTRAAELALRLRYAGWPGHAIEVDEDIAASLDRALARSAGSVVALPTYTALIELRTLLTKRGHAPPYWA
jgi:lipid II isoglutaminyl synthase (glutamine-hydrolysing)